MAGELGPSWPEGSPFIETHVRNRVRRKIDKDDIVDPYLRGDIVKVVGNIIADLGFPSYPPKELHFDIDGNKFEAVKPPEETTFESD